MRSSSQSAAASKSSWRYRAASSANSAGISSDRLGVGHALVVGLEVPRGHGHEVDDAPEVVLGAHGNLGGHGVGVQTVAHGLDGMEEVGTHAVVLVDEGDAGHAVTLGLAPHRLGLRLHAGNGVEHGDGAVENAQRTLDLSGEVHVAGGVDDLEAVSLPSDLPPGYFQKHVVAAAVMVTPRSCSWTIQSIVAAPSWTSPIL